MAYPRPFALLSLLLLAFIIQTVRTSTTFERRWTAKIHHARRQTSPSNTSSTTPPASTNDDATHSNVTATIDFMLSNWWNNTKYLAQSNPNVPFLKNVSFVTQSQNATNTTPLIVGVEVQERRQYQRMKGLGASITDATAIVLQSLRKGHPDAYDEILNLAFNESPDWIAKGGAGMNMIRIPIGASDFGFTQYTYDDSTDGTPDPALKFFDIEKSPKRWQTIQDILKINPHLITIASAWSPPAWMKNSTGALGGGEIVPEYEEAYCDYLVKFVKTVKSHKGITVQYLTLANEPLYTTTVRPTTKMTSEQQARIGTTCRAKLDDAGLTKTKILAFDHNWDSYKYPIEVYDQAKEAFGGVAWHCYGGEPKQQDFFNQAYPGEEIMMTECTRITQYGDETWNNLQKQFNELITGSIDYMSSAIVLWNMALQVDEQGFTVPVLPDQCLNCLAPFLIFDNSTQPNLEGANVTQLNDIHHSDKPSNGKRDVTDDDSTTPTRRDNEPEQSDSTPGASKVDPLPQESAQNVSPNDMNDGALNDGKIIPPYRDTYYQTSDFVAMAHLGQAIRPNSKGGRWAQRVGVRTTDDDNQGGRLKAQLFRNGLGNGTSRWSLCLLQWYDHYNYYYAAHEDMTVQVKFRNATATFTIPPGVYTIQWTAPDSKFEHDYEMQ